MAYPRYLPPFERLIAIVGLVAFFCGTVPGISARYATLLDMACIAVALFFLAHYAMRLRRAGAGSTLKAALSGGAIVDLLGAVPIPLALILGAPGSSARLWGVFWSLQFIRGNPAFALLGRVLRNERNSLVSVTLAFVVVLLFAATAAFIVEHTQQPEAFASVPAALWWAVTTLTTTGYGDKIPASFAGRLLAGATMVSGIGLFALWAGILASGFSQELRRSEFLESWDLVVRLPLFRNLGAAALSSIASVLKAQECGAGAFIVRAGEPGDSMYFIASGGVEVRAGIARIRLAPGQFFGEMALIKSSPRNADVVGLEPSRLLRLDVVDFRSLADRQPELLAIIEAESARRDTIGAT